MPNKNYLRGRRLEYQVKKDLEAQGWHVLRTSGSHGAYDLIAISDHLVFAFIQCKVTKSNNIKQLVKEFKKTSPVKDWLVEGSVEVRPWLIIKQTGEANYKIYSIYGEQVTNV